MLCKTDRKGSEDTFSNELCDKYKIQHQSSFPQETSKQASTTHSSIKCLLESLMAVSKHLSAPCCMGKAGSSVVAAVPTGAVLAGWQAVLLLMGPTATTRAHLGNAPAGHRAQLTPAQPLKSHSITFLHVTTASNNTLISRM